MKIKELIRNKWFIIFSIFFLLLSMCSAITHEYGPYYGKVIDAETKEPIEGAAVLAVYYTEGGISPGGVTSRLADTQETLTDKKGEFKIPSIRIFTYVPFDGWAPYPQIKIFKPAYGCYPDHKDVKLVSFPDGLWPVSQSVTIDLPKLKTREERIENDCLPVNIPTKKMPLFLKTTNAERRGLGFGAQY